MKDLITHAGDALIEEQTRQYPWLNIRDWRKGFRMGHSAESMGYTRPDTLSADLGYVAALRNRANFIEDSARMSAKWRAANPNEGYELR